MPAAPPTRRRFQFGLRTLLVLVTALAAFLGYHLDWIRQRRAVIRASASGHASFVVSDPSDDPFGDSPKPARAPGVLWLFGERGYDRLEVTFRDPELDPKKFVTTHELMPLEQREVDRIKALYPEAKINAWADRNWDNAKSDSPPEMPLDDSQPSQGQPP